MFDPITMAATGAIGAAMPSISNYLFPNPAKGAMPYLDKIPGTIKPYYDPYIKTGERMLPGMEDIFNQLMKDPNSIIARMGAGYKQSPGYQFRLGQGQQAVENANAAGGMAGTLQHQQQGAQVAEDMASEDYDKYMQQVMGMFGLGTQGGMDLTKLGQQSATDLATNLAQTLMSQAGLKYAGQDAANKSTGSLINSAMSLFGFGDKK